MDKSNSKVEGIFHFHVPPRKQRFHLCQEFVKLAIPQFEKQFSALEVLSTLILTSLEVLNRQSSSVALLLQDENYIIHVYRVYCFPNGCITAL